MTDENNTGRALAIPAEPRGGGMLSVFSDVNSFETAQRMAKALASSTLVPDTYRENPGNCLIAMEVAQRTGSSILAVTQNLHVIHGRPSWSSSYIIAAINSCGRFSPLRFEEDDKEGGRTRAWAYDLGNNEKVYGAWVSMEMAKAEGWMNKNGSKWKTMPELMRRYRAASFFGRQFAPEILMGMQTREEVEDFVDEETRFDRARDVTPREPTPDLKPPASTSAPANDNQPSPERAALEKRANELGVEFRANIKDETLAQRIKEAEDAIALASKSSGGSAQQSAPQVVQPAQQQKPAAAATNDDDGDLF